MDIVLKANTFYLGWGTLCLINAVLAQGKNRSGLNWFLISVFIGPVSTFLLAIIEKLPSRQQVISPDKSTKTK